MEKKLILEPGYSVHLTETSLIGIPNYLHK